jgi:D-alanyl-D-alanine carboxypeptidase
MNCDFFTGIRTYKRNIQVQVASFLRDFLKLKQMLHLKITPMKIPDPRYLQKQLDEIIRKKNVYSAVLCVESGDGNFSWSGAAGEMRCADRYFIASVTKLYITIVVKRLIQQGLLSLENTLQDFYPVETISGLHVYKGVEYSTKITLRHLISNTSGLPDYFFYKESGRESAADLLLEGQDSQWGFDRTIEMVKAMKPGFPPGYKRKAAYSDTNYQILGDIIEKVTGKTIHQVFKTMIADELGLKDTYAYNDINDRTPRPFWYKDRSLWLPQYICSVTPEGGLVSTAAECMAVLKAFFQGRFFPVTEIEHMKDWRLIFPPPGLFMYGVGLEKLWIPRFLTPFKPIGEILGFWGQTGSFAWYSPKFDLYFTGTTNQINGAGHSAASKAIFRTLKSVR